MTEFDKFINMADLNKQDIWEDKEHQGVLFINCPHDVPMAFRQSDGKFMFGICEPCKELMNMPDVTRCKVVCNQGEIMPLMQYYVDGLGKSVRKAADEVELFYRKKYGDESPVTADRARMVYQNRKGYNDSSESLKPSDSSTLISEPESAPSVDMEYDLDWALSVFQVEPELTPLGFKVLRHGLDKHYFIVDKPEKQAEVEKAAKVLEEYGYGDYNGSI